MTRIVVTPRAGRDVDDAKATLGLPADAWSRVARSLRVLEDFPLAGRALEGRWSETRFVLGPWPWMILVYVYVYAEGEDTAFVIAMHDARASTTSRGGTASKQP